MKGDVDPVVSSAIFESFDNAVAHQETDFDVDILQGDEAALVMISGCKASATQYSSLSWKC